MFDLKKIVRKNIETLKPYSSSRNEYDGSDGVFLDANENPYGAFNRYPDPYQKELKKLLATRNQLNTNKIFIGNGSDEVIDLVFRVFCEPANDKALTFVPTYGMYQVLADINGIELISEDLDSNFEINMSGLKSKLSDERLKLILICSPNNPTGNCASKESVEQILKMFSGIVLIDEAYIEFAADKSMLDLIDEYPNLIISRTMSKAWGLASARIGVAFASNEIINYLNKVKPPYNISLPNQKAAIQALLNTQTFDSNLRSIIKEKEKLENALRKLELVEKVYPSEANFMLIKVADADRLYKKLVNNMIVIRNRTNQIKNCLRITVGSPSENKQLIECLKKVNDEKSTFYR